MKVKLKPWLIFTLFLVFSSFISKAQFPYYESFKNATAPGIVFGGDPTALLTAAAGIDPVGEGYLRLTNNQFNQKGYIYSTTDFPSSTGLRIQFEYYTYGGTGADGICFFLFDASANPFNIGGFGGSLGYSQFSLTNPITPGVSKGYLGVGIDEYGNFSNPIEGRQGGVVGPPPNGLLPKSVTLRGKGNGSALTPNNYPFLTTAQTKDLGFELVYDSPNRWPDSTTVGYRKAEIDLNPNPAGGYNITVKISTGTKEGKTKTYTVINNYYYNQPAPPLLRYGISSSTGYASNFHEIRGVFIDDKPTVNPVAVDDSITSCAGKPVTIDVVANDSSPNIGGVIDKTSLDLNPDLAGVQKTYTATGFGVFTANSDGTVSYSPLSNSVSGRVVCNYTIQDNFGKVSNVASIIIKEPTNPLFANAGTDQLVNISTSSGSTTLLGNSVAGATGQWTQVSGPSGAVIVNPSSPTTTVNNMVLGVYKFRWVLSSPTQCNASDDVQILVNAVPVAVNDDVKGVYNQQIQINVLNNDTDRDGNNTLDIKTVSIKSNPVHGSAVVDPVTGIVTYTPDSGYSGTDSFTYTVKDVNGAESNIATVTITIPSLPKIGLAKALTKGEKLLNGSFNLTFVFTITNYSSVTLQNLSLKDDLTANLSGANYSVISLKASPNSNLVVNNSYNGSTQTELFLGNNQLFSQQTASIELVVNMKPVGNISNFFNTAIVQGNSIVDGAPATDISTNGLKPDPNTPGDVTPQDPTPINLALYTLYIPGGFSPNGDGKHDKFVIKRPNSDPLTFEVYNRWGNIVYKSDNYKDDWDGRCTEGISIGQDLPPGTYYYIVTFNSSKYVGYLTLNR